RDVLLRHSDLPVEALHGEIHGALGPQALENLLAARHVAITPSVRNPGDAELAQMTVAEELAKLATRNGLRAEIAEASEDLSGLADEAVTWRLGQAAQARNTAERSQHEDTAEYDIAENGIELKRSERSDFAALMDKVSATKPRR
ncbi:MAG: hypothetical protein ABJJ37_01705, partial [Roseibium sp.]